MRVQLVAGVRAAVLMLAVTAACARGTPLVAQSPCLDRPFQVPKTAMEEATHRDRLIPETVATLGEPALDSQAGKGAMFVRVGFGIGDNASVSSIERSSDGCTLSIARKIPAPNACNVLHVQASLPAWQCDYLVECMLNTKDWETLQSRAAPLHAEGFEWVEGTDGNWNRVMQVKPGGGEVPLTRLETCLRDWRDLAWALAKSVGYGVQ